MNIEKHSIGSKVKQSVLSFFLRIFVHPKLVYKQALESLPEDKNAVICYVLPYRSLADQLILKRVCQQLNLPLPHQEYVINGNVYLNTFALSRALRLGLKSEQRQALFTQFNAYKSAEFAQNVLFLPINIMFGKAPDRKLNVKKSNPVCALLRKWRQVLFSGRRCFILFAKPMPLTDLLNSEYNDEFIYRMAKGLFQKQYDAFIGPVLPKRADFLKPILNQPSIQAMITEEAESSRESRQQIEHEASKMLDEITANYKYGVLKMTDIVLSFAWHKLYQGLQVQHGEKVRQLARDGQEIIFAPCHRSHMDYLLLSYVLYREGLMPPHIAAGVNLNFWPAGPIFRRLGAFFIRRTFRGNKLYTLTFREYLAALFRQGFSVEYFMEGGRSRTGRLLDPKTGLLLLTVQALLQKNMKPITIVPVYIGYEHVLEVKTYDQELNGATKKTENMWQMLKGFKKLKKLGFGYVNFGDPISIHQYLNQAVPNWQQDRQENEAARPRWLMSAVNQLSIKVMENINRAAALNAMNLVSLILLSSQNQLPKNTLLMQIDLHLDLIKKVPYSDQVTFPDSSAEAMFNHLIEMNKFTITHENQENPLIALQNPQYKSYYRNNIQHLFVLPALVVLLLNQQEEPSSSQIIEQVLLIYPLLKGEFFLSFSETVLLDSVEKWLEYFAQQHDFTLNNSTLSFKNAPFEILANHLLPSLNRYDCLLKILRENPDLTRGALEKQWREACILQAKQAQIITLDEFDKTLYAQLMTAFKQEHYFTDSEKQMRLEWLLNVLLSKQNKDNSSPIQ